MTTKIDDGGPAFPRPLQEDPHGNYVGGDAGMTLRDYFAGQAMISIISQNGSNPYYRKDTAADYAEHAFAFADAMLKERAR